MGHVVLERLLLLATMACVVSEWPTIPRLEVSWHIFMFQHVQSISVHPVIPTFELQNTSVKHQISFAFRLALSLFVKPYENSSAALRKRSSINDGFVSSNGTVITGSSIGPCEPKIWTLACVILLIGWGAFILFSADLVSLLFSTLPAVYGSWTSLDQDKCH